MSAPCPICRSPRTRPVVPVGGVVLRGCRSCGAAFVWPRPDRAAVQEAAERSAAKRLRRERTRGVLDRITEQNRHLLDYLDRHGCSGSLLDIGCGRGLLLADARARGWTAMGVEPVPGAAEEGVAERGLDIRVGTLESVALPPASFDAAVFSHSLEHFIDPAGAMKTAARLVKPGGWIYVETPNWGSLSRRLLGRRWWNVDPANHPFLFSPRAVELMGRAAGLEMRDSWGTHFDLAAVLIRLARFADPALNDIAGINEWRDRLFRIRGAWRASRIAEAVAGALLGRGFLNDYMACWFRRPSPPPAGEIPS